MILRSVPYLRNTFPAVCDGLMPMPLFVMMALVSAHTLNCSAIYLTHVMNGASSGTEIDLKVYLGSDANTILNETIFFFITNLSISNNIRINVNGVNTQYTQYTIVSQLMMNN